ncbi:MAG: protein kinase family protein, partial [Halorubrum sp.]
MELRRLVRGRVDWPDIERVVRELADRYDRDGMRVRFLDADNWLSTPMVLDDELFVKVITRQNTLVHTLFTTGRNLGAVSAGTEGFFERYETPYEMARHELEATRRVRE